MPNSHGLDFCDSSCIRQRRLCYYRAPLNSTVRSLTWLGLHAGWADPVLAAALGRGSRAAEVRLAFAWPNATAPMEVLHKNTSQLSHKDDLLIFERNITTGKTAEYDVPQMVRCSYLLLPPPEHSA